ncbi:MULTISPECIES: hypothetical protein, partial [Paraburkholderia]|uniref:hypothetical protein n=1 Tax=Paraburkholderia TaxID=1822464 RepID=UPI00224EA66C
TTNSGERRQRREAPPTQQKPPTPGLRNLGIRSAQNLVEKYMSQAVQVESEAGVLLEFDCHASHAASVRLVPLPNVIMERV